MSSVIQNILDGALGDGARASKFECFINFNYPQMYQKQNDLYALVKSSQFPGKTHDTIDLKFKGRTIPIKGQVKYDNTWSCTFYLTEDHSLKRAFEDWIESLDEQHNVKNVNNVVYNGQLRNNPMTGSGYTQTIKIAQLSFDGSNGTTIYELHHCFPKSVSAVEVDYGSIGTILEFTVEFSYAYYDSYRGETELPTLAEQLKGAALNTVNDLTDSIKAAVASGFNNLLGSNNEAKSTSTPSSSFFKSKNSMTTKRDW